MKKVLVIGGGEFIGSHIAEFYFNNKNIAEILIIDSLSRDKLLIRELSIRIISAYTYLYKN